MPTMGATFAALTMLECMQRIIPREAATRDASSSGIRDGGFMVVTAGLVKEVESTRLGSKICWCLGGRSKRRGGGQVDV